MTCWEHRHSLPPSVPVTGLLNHSSLIQEQVFFRDLTLWEVKSLYVWMVTPQDLVVMDVKRRKTTDPKGLSRSGSSVSMLPWPLYPITWSPNSNSTWWMDVNDHLVASRFLPIEGKAQPWLCPKRSFNFKLCVVYFLYKLCFFYNVNS